MRETVEAESMGKEMTARTERCSRGLYGGRESEARRAETEGELNSRRCTPGLEDQLLLFSDSRPCFQPVTEDISLSSVPFSGFYLPLKTQRWKQIEDIVRLGSVFL